MADPIGLIIRRIDIALKKHADRAWGAFDITMSQGMILHFISQQRPGTVSQRDIEHRFGLRHPTVSGILKRLEQSGFVEFGTKEADHRVKIVNETEKAKQVGERLKAGHERMDRQIVRGLTAEEQAQLRSLLLRVLDNISQQEPEEREW